jgi:hypothetical protein
MSEGISLEFRRKVGKIDQLIQQNKQVTEIVFFQENQLYILYIITKEWHTQKPTYEKMFFAMKNLRRFCESHNIKKVALSKIGNGCDLLDWKQVCTIIRYVFKNSDINILIYSIDTYSEEEKHNIIEEFRSYPLGGHQGVSRTIKKIKQHHNWKNLKKDVIEYIKACESCKINKSDNRTVKQPMIITSTANKPFEKVCLDVVNPCTSRGVK